MTKPITFTSIINTLFTMIFIVVVNIIIVPTSNAEEATKKSIAKEEIKVPAGRTAELGLIAYRKYPRYYKVRKEKGILKYLKSFCPDVEIISEDVDVFLPENYDKLKHYKRIWIPGYAVLFTQKMYDGMQKYMNDGGLLISNETMPIIDKNEDYKYSTKEDSFFKKRSAGNPVLGVQGANSADYSEIKVVKQTPLTSGIEMEQWLALKPCAGRHVHSASSANIAVIAKGKTKYHDSTEMPFLTYKQQGKGASIYLASAGGGELIKMLVSNILSEATLNWLCIQ